jgi:hypothetical protein
MAKSDLKLDTRVDDYALDTFGNMGYDTAKLPDTLVKLYTVAKRKKDVIFPSRMSAEGCAIVATLSDMIDKRGEFAVEKKAEGAK